MPADAPAVRQGCDMIRRAFLRLMGIAPAVAAASAAAAQDTQTSTLTEALGALRDEVAALRAEIRAQVA